MVSKGWNYVWNVVWCWMTSHQISVMIPTTVFTRILSPGLISFPECKSAPDSIKLSTQQTAQSLSYNELKSFSLVKEATQSINLWIILLNFIEEIQMNLVLGVGLQELVANINIHHSIPHYYKL